jgi:hypothetical protein
VVLQLVLVAIVIFVPQTVTVFLDKELKIDLDKVVIPDAQKRAPQREDKQSIEDLFKNFDPPASAPR